jgi:hypothetical protein
MWKKNTKKAGENAKKRSKTRELVVMAGRCNKNKGINVFNVGCMDRYMFTNASLNVHKMEDSVTERNSIFL